MATSSCHGCWYNRIVETGEDYNRILAEFRTLCEDGMFDTAIRVHPFRPEGHFGRGKVLASEGNHAEAIYEFNHAMFELIISTEYKQEILAEKIKSLKAIGEPTELEENWFESDYTLKYTRNEDGPARKIRRFRY
jgi:hypothetical protein